MLSEVPPESLDVLKDLDQAIEDFRRIREQIAVAQPEKGVVAEVSAPVEAEVAI